MRKSLEQEIGAKVDHLESLLGGLLVGTILSAEQQSYRKIVLYIFKFVQEIFDIIEDESIDIIFYLYSRNNDLLHDFELSFDHGDVVFFTDDTIDTLLSEGNDAIAQTRKIIQELKMNPQAKKINIKVKKPESK